MTPPANPPRWGCWRVVVAAYLVLLLASHLVRVVSPWQAPPPPAAVSFLEVPERHHAGHTTGETLSLAYWQWQPPAATQAASTLMLLHGSPGSGADFQRLGAGLAARGFRVIAPDLPGFGYSSREVADYSFRNHAWYCQDLARALALERFDVVGYSMGGGVALHLADDLPNQVRSVTLLSAIGVQELELLGAYQVNHGIHLAQWLGLLALYEGFPHFGAFDGGMLSVEYARNFYDSDQRPLRGILRRLAMPVAILHGRHDRLVPFAAALEHHRLVPQSELVVFEADHFMVYEEPEALVEPLVAFVSAVDAGRARSLATADPERVVAADQPMQVVQEAARGPALLAWFALLALSTLISEDLTCIAAGLLVARGVLGWVSGSLACAVGIFVGDLLLYATGRLGRPWIEKGFLRRWIRADDIARSRRFFDRRGAIVIFLSRFMPGTRLPVYVTAGLIGMGFWRFAFFLLLPVALWTPLLVGLATVLGEQFFAFFGEYENAAPLFIGLLVLLWSLLALVRSLTHWRGRRRWVGLWHRWRYWEFWPAWALYPPVVVYLMFLAVRYRSATLFTAANPGMPGGGGFVGESKSAILRGLAPEAVATWRLLPEGTFAERRRAVAIFQEEQGAGGEWPVVLKPDVGQRGSGVVVARDSAAIDLFLEAVPGPAIVQRFVAGPELGIFYVRLPNEPRGRIVSITDKQLPVIIGDGVSSVERLILQDARAVALADVYLARWHDRRDEVLARGERRQLVDLGTHCRGAVFVDGAEYHTPELEAAVDRIAQSYAGFYFGRFDFRAPSFDHFRRGEGLQVLELNGVTSEPTHMYDRRHAVWVGWAALCRQWRLAFEIGAQNRARGFEPATFGELWAMVRAFRRRVEP